MSYAESSYFDGAHFAHIAAWEEIRRLARIQLRAVAQFQRLPLAERRRGGRAAFRK